MTGATLRVRDLGVHFPRRPHPAVSALDLTVPAGVHHLLIGPSGAGKSTVLRVLAGVVPDIVHAEVTGTVDAPGRVGYVQQNPRDALCLPTVESEVAFALECSGTEPSEIGPRVRAALRAVGADHLPARDPSTLSGGEAQRVALAATLVAAPELLVVDEPTAMLDPGAARTVARLVAGLRGPSVVLAEHRLDEGAPLPEEVTVLGERGAVVAAGRTATVLTTEHDRLEDQGCWLPLEVRAAVHGAHGALARAHTYRRARRARAGGAAAPLLTTHGLGVQRGAGPVLLRDVDLALRPGTITAVIGINGAGKSTLLRALSSVEEACGSVRGARVSYVAQDPEHQILGRTVHDDVALGAVRDVASILATFGLDEHAGHDPFRLSGGEQRRLSLAVAIASGRAVLALDEPTSGLDRVQARAVLATLDRHCADGGAVVLTTHDLTLAAENADHVLVLHGGRVVAHGTPDEVLLPHLLRRWGLDEPELLRARRCAGLRADGRSGARPQVRT